MKTLQEHRKTSPEFLLYIPTINSVLLESPFGPLLLTEYSFTVLSYSPSSSLEYSLQYCHLPGSRWIRSNETKCHSVFCPFLVMIWSERLPICTPLPDFSAVMPNQQCWLVFEWQFGILQREDSSPFGTSQHSTCLWS